MTSARSRKAPRPRKPPHDPTDLVDGELRKSGDTRRRIMEAAVQCLATYGYAGTNAVTVADQAGLTRPAMLYHFPTRIALIEAVINYVTLQRIARFESVAADAGQSPDRVARAVDLAWAENQTSLYRAYCELANASRTDPDLAAVFEPAMLAYDQARRASAQQIFTDEQRGQPGFDLRRDIVRFLLDGLAEHAWAIDEGLARREAVLSFLKCLLLEQEGLLLSEKALAIGRKKGRRRTPHA